MLIHVRTNKIIIPDIPAIFLNKKNLFQNTRFLENMIALMNKYKNDLLKMIQFTYVSQNTYV